MFGPLFNLNFIEEITYLTPPPPKAMKNMHECRPGLWGLDTPTLPASLFVIENFILDSPIPWNNFNVLKETLLHRIL